MSSADDTTQSLRITSTNNRKTHLQLSALKQDWSGRGSHVEFAKNESLPFTQGRTLGYGLNGEVVQVTCKGMDLAMKRIRQRRHLSNVQVGEIEVLKSLSHRHIVQIVGTFYQAPHIGLLMWPVATCDLATVLEIMDVTSRAKDDEHVRPMLEDMLSANHLTGDHAEDLMVQASNIFGCLTSAVAYLHRNNVRHKDIKPSNVLLSRDSIWLTDFGSAKDFTNDLTSSSESRERGTLRYCAPEVAQFAQSGRSADIFSLGCTFLEFLIAAMPDTSMAELEELRPAKNHSYEANLDRTDDWLELLKNAEEVVIEEVYLCALLKTMKTMLDADRSKRPTATTLAVQIAALDDNGKEFHCRHCSAWYTQDPLANFEELKALRRTG